MNGTLPPATIGSNGLRAEPWLSSQDERDSLPRNPGLPGCPGTSERVRPKATTGSSGLRAEPWLSSQDKRDSLPRSERGVWGVWRNTPQNRE
jgi:hypothetical protein